MTSHYGDLTKSFEARDLDPGNFRHLDHVGVAYEMLRKYEFMQAAVKYAENIDAIATKAGAADKFNVTITFAFMSLIAERMATGDHTNYEEFRAQNQDLISQPVLRNWYSKDRLNSALARRVFLLPDRAN